MLKYKNCIFSKTLISRFNASESERMAFALDRVITDYEKIVKLFLNS